jgi:hypothetical protein
MIAHAVHRNDGATANREYQSMIDHHGDLAVEMFRERGFFERG